MVRTYDPDRSVPTRILSELLDLAVRAPSAGFSQGWDFIVLRTPPDIARFWSTCAEPPAPDNNPDRTSDQPPEPKPDRWLQGMQTAPVLLLCVSDADRYLDRYAETDKGWTDRDPARWPVPYWDVDTGMASLLLLLAAVDAGLAGCFFGVPPGRQAAVLAELSAPSSRRIVGVVSLGYPAPDGNDRRSPSLRRGRRLLTEVTHDGVFGNPFPLDLPVR